MKKFLAEFKEFAIKGNAIDLAVGVVLGGAFGAIVTSLVNDIITPLISLILGSENFENMVVVLKKAVGTVDTAGYKAAVVLSYGKFIQTTINFIIIALVIFMVIRILNRLKRKKEVEEVQEEVAEKAEDLILLEEILQELRKQNNTPTL